MTKCFQLTPALFSLLFFSGWHSSCCAPQKKSFQFVGKVTCPAFQFGTLPRPHTLYNLFTPLCSSHSFHRRPLATASLSSSAAHVTPFMQSPRVCYKLKCHKQFLHFSHAATPALSTHAPYSSVCCANNQRVTFPYWAHITLHAAFNMQRCHGNRNGFTFQCSANSGTPTSLCARIFSGIFWKWRLTLLMGAIF